MAANPDQKRVFALLPAVFALYWVIYGQIMEFDPGPKKRPFQPAMSEQSELPKRQPASIPPSTESVLTINCEERGIVQHVTEERFLRVVGTNCLEAKDINLHHENAEIRPQIFWTKNSAFSSELILLKEGSNTMKLSFFKDDKTISREFVLLRNQLNGSN